ncbi:MAG: hypothetical protein QOJ86_5013 [Bradyrhizobium sp.]|nr:hypothetical protein [Bradyrhizobium sp.]
MNSNDLLDDCRLQLPDHNVFRFCQQNGMPEMPVGKTEETCFRTAAEIEAARLAAKKK